MFLADALLCWNSFRMSIKLRLQTQIPRDKEIVDLCRFVRLQYLQAGLAFWKC